MSRLICDMRYSNAISSGNLIIDPQNHVLNASLLLYRGRNRRRPVYNSYAIALGILLLTVALVVLYMRLGNCTNKMERFERLYTR
jgi:hypothetical protein